jgi:hypothetical protein
LENKIIELEHQNDVLLKQIEDNNNSMIKRVEAEAHQRKRWMERFGEEQDSLQ